MNRQQKIKLARDLAVNGLPTVKPIPINYLVKKDGVYYFESDISFQNPLHDLPEGVPVPINMIFDMDKQKAFERDVLKIRK